MDGHSGQHKLRIEFYHLRFLTDRHSQIKANARMRLLQVSQQNTQALAHIGCQRDLPVTPSRCLDRFSPQRVP
jgi:hypothetical protein